MITPRLTCRDCGHAPLAPIYDLGSLALSAFPAAGDPPPPSAPLTLTQCDHCGLVQLGHTVDPDCLFREYWYRSGVNETMITELRSIVQQAVGWTPVRRGSVVLDIGANDGTLLQQYAWCDRDPYKVAVDPARTFTADLRCHADDVWDTYFPDPDLIHEFHGKVRVLTSIACVYDLDDPHAFVEGVYQLLAPGGVWVVQFQDLAQMLAATAFDNLCHEHLVYYSLDSFAHLIEPHGLRIVHAERRSINGGSLRLIVQREEDGREDMTVGACRRQEAGCADWETLSKFSWRAGQAAAQIRAAIRAARADDWVVDLYGASTKANTLLQVCGLGPTEIRQAWERSPAKWDRRTVTGIPITSEHVGRIDPPRVLLCGIWQFRDAILQREREYLRAGGQILFPLPVVDLVVGGDAW